MGSRLRGQAPVATAPGTDFISEPVPNNDLLLTAFAFVVNMRSISSKVCGRSKSSGTRKRNMSANIAEANPTTPAAAAPVPKRITNAQTVCNERNEKNKLCNGHLKQLRTGGEAAEVHLRGDDVLYKCTLCGTLYMGPPLGHVRDPEKQSRFVEAELSALLQAAGGTLPVIEKNEKGVYVIVEQGGGGPGHAAPAAKPAPSVAIPAAVVAKPAPQAPQATAVAEDRKSTRLNSSHANISYTAFCFPIT